MGRLNRFGKIFESCVSEKAFPYEHKNDYPPNFGWNSEKSACCTKYMSHFDCCELSFSLETPYFGKKDNVFCLKKQLNWADALLTQFTDISKMKQIRQKFLFLVMHCAIRP